jgi:hypothetical protein
MREQRIGYLWVVEIRKVETGAVISRRSFRTPKEASAWKYHLDEMPDPDLDGCRVEMNVEVIEYPSPENRALSGSPLWFD